MKYLFYSFVVVFICAAWMALIFGVSLVYTNIFPDISAQIIALATLLTATFIAVPFIAYAVEKGF